VILLGQVAILNQRFCLVVVDGSSLNFLCTLILCGWGNFVLMQHCGLVLNSWFLLTDLCCVGFFTSNFGIQHLPA
jgi:hypothetical protein